MDLLYADSFDGFCLVLFRPMSAVSEAASSMVSTGNLPMPDPVRLTSSCSTRVVTPVADKTTAASVSRVMDSRSDHRPAVLSHHPGTAWALPGGSSRRSTTTAVHPVWCDAPSPAPLSPWKYS